MCVKSTICKRLFAALIIISALLCYAISSFAAEVIGTVPWLLTATSEENSRYRQCSLGDAAADAVLRYLEADIAIVNGGDLIGNLLPGETSAQDVRECIRENMNLATATVSGEELRVILESALSHVTLTEGRDYDAENSCHDAFPQIAGFRISYDPGQQPGNRISRLTYNDKPVNPDDSFRLAATENMLSGGYGLPAVSEYVVSSCSLDSVMEQYIRDGMDEYAVMKTRVYAMDVRAQHKYNRQTVLMCVGLAAVLLALFIPLVKKNQKLNEPK